MQQRHLKDFGIQPLLAVPVMVVLFAAFSYYLFERLSYAGYLYPVLALSFIIKNSDSSRNDFLKFVFSRPQYFIVRMAENMLSALPFIIFLCWKHAFLPALLLFLLSACLGLVRVKLPGHMPIPTPFYKKPFEFIIGFRRQFFILLPVFALTCIGLLYQNFNVGLFSLAIVFLLCMSFYNEPEESFFVWIHSLLPAAFLWDKIKTALLFSTLLTLPVSIVLGLFFPAKAWIILLVNICGYAYLVTVILAKYAAFPNRMSLPQTLLLAVCIVVPPLMLPLAPYFYIQSKKRLNNILR